MNKLLVKHSTEFVVVFLDIGLSFCVDCLH